MALNTATNTISGALPQFYKDLVASYPCSTDEPITIYVPSSDYYHPYTHYIIYKKVLNGETFYRAIFFYEFQPMMLCIGNDSKPKLACLELRLIGTTSPSLSGVSYTAWSSYLGNQRNTVYTTTNYATLADCINAIQTSTYSSTSTNNYYAFDEGCEVIYANVPVFDARVNYGRTGEFLQLQKISSNETYHL